MISARVLGVRAIVLVVAIATATAGCASQPGGADRGAVAVTTTHVDLPKSYKFAPASIQVAIGSTVTWTNSDNFTHSVQFAGEDAPGAVLKPGDSTSRTFDQAGSFTYVCAFHPQNMTGTVIVTEASGSAAP